MKLVRPSDSNLGTSLQLDAGIGGFELPVGFDVVPLPCVHFVGEEWLVGEPPIRDASQPSPNYS